MDSTDRRLPQVRTLIRIGPGGTRELSLLVFVGEAAPGPAAGAVVAEAARPQRTRIPVSLIPPRGNATGR